MKKLMMILGLGLIVGNISAYSLTVKNETSFDIFAEAGFGGAGVCGPKQFTISAGKMKKVGTGGCCLDWLTIKAPSVRLGQKQTVSQIHASGRRTGFGISCKSNTFVVREIAGQVVAERQ